MSLPQVIHSFHSNYVSSSCHLYPDLRSLRAKSLPCFNPSKEYDLLLQNKWRWAGSIWFILYSATYNIENLASIISFISLVFIKITHLFVSCIGKLVKPILTAFDFVKSHYDLWYWRFRLMWYISTDWETGFNYKYDFNRKTLVSIAGYNSVGTNFCQYY